jgi:hypothetical protein
MVRSDVSEWVCSLRECGECGQARGRDEKVGRGWSFGARGASNDEAERETKVVALAHIDQAFNELLVYKFLIGGS